MIKDLFILWIVVQLMLIGWAVATIHNQIIDETYECSGRNKISRLGVMSFPLAVFIPEIKEIEEYCERSESN